MPKSDGDNVGSEETILAELFGEDVIPVVRVLKEKGKATDEEIAQELDVKVNIVRKVLYKLYENRLARYTRHRDPESGWYTYTWELDLRNLEDLLRKKRREILEKLKERLRYEESHIFFRCKCPDGENRVPFEVAMEMQFFCPKCNTYMEQEDNSKMIEFLRERIRVLEEQLS